MAVVVLPTPPFWFATAITRPMGEFWRRANLNVTEALGICKDKIAVQMWEKGPGVPRGTELPPARLLRRSRAVRGKLQKNLMASHRGGSDRA